MGQTSEAIILAAGPLQLELSPSIGGAIRNFSWSDGARRIPLMRESHSGAQSVLELASFPLVPFVNRIRGGQFDFRGRTVSLAPNMAGDKSPLHGQGWLCAWEVIAADATSAQLAFEHAAGEWPWAYRAEQEFTLTPEALSVALTCTNLADEPMPCGLGQHPYFPCTAETRIATQVRTAFEIDADVLPTGEVPAVGRFDLADRPVCGLGLDHGFGGWGGEARLSDPAWPAALALTSPDARFFQLYSPATGGIFVAEPVTHANAALNAPEADWPRLGIRILSPGETMRLDMTIALA